MERHEIKKTASQERKSGRVRMRPSCSTARLLQWSLLLVARLTSSGARAAGWEGWGNIRRMGQRGGSPLPGDGPSDADFDSIIQQLELDQVRKISYIGCFCHRQCSLLPCDQVAKHTVQVALISPPCSARYFDITAPGISLYCV